MIFLEVEQFQIQTPGDLNMVHGEAKVHIQVFEMEYPKNSKDKPIKDQPKEAHNIYDEYAESTFPNRGPLPIDTGNSRSAFRNTFLKIVVKEVSWHFVEHARKTRSRIRGSRSDPSRMRDSHSISSELSFHPPPRDPSQSMTGPARSARFFHFIRKTRPRSIAGTVDSGLSLLIIEPESISRDPTRIVAHVACAWLHARNDRGA